MIIEGERIIIKRLDNGSVRVDLDDGDITIPDAVFIQTSPHQGVIFATMLEGDFNIKVIAEKKLEVK